MQIHFHRTREREGQVPGGAHPRTDQQATFPSPLVLVDHARLDMCLKYAVFFTALVLSAADKPTPSADFSGSDDSEIDFGTSVDGAQKGTNGFESSQRDNEVASDSGGFLRNFKSLHNTTDLQALASDVHNEQVGSSQQEQTAADRVDNNPRVLRGAGGVPGLDHPLFTPYKHNKIDTADFSDCALQGEWQPIGGPTHHNYAHHEDSQKEHFHAVAESPEAFPNIAASAPSSHGSVTSEGLAFWNQFIQGSNNHKANPFETGKVNKFQKQPFASQLHSQHHKQKPSPLKKFPSALTPTSQLSFSDLDVFQNIRNPDSDYNVLKIQQKPSYDDFGGAAQNILVQKPQFNDIDFSLVPKNPVEPFPPTGSLRASEDYLSPPPVPQRLPSHKPEKQKPVYPPRPKFPFKAQKTPYKIRGPSPLRAPPPVNEQVEDSNQGHTHSSPLHHNPHHQEIQIQQNQHQEDVHHHKQHHQEPPHHHHQDLNHHHHQEPQHNHLQHQQPSESSTFTCGHNHAQGTNYHTASYQVEGESDPSLLADESGGNQFAAPIILGQPSFEHSNHFEDDTNDLFTLQGNQRLPKNSYPPLDLEEEGTEHGGSTLREVANEGGYVSVNPYAEKQIQQTTASESVTMSSMTDTTAPQKFMTQQHSSDDLQKDNIHDSDTHMPSFDMNFDHSGFSHVDLSAFNSAPASKGQSSKNNNFGPTVTGDIVSEFYSNQPQLNNQQQSEATSNSEPGGFFGSFFTSPFLEGSVNPEGPPSAPPQRQTDKSSFPQSFSEFSFNDFNKKPSNKGKYHKAAIAVFEHGPPHNKTKNHLSPPKKRPHKHYEVSENSGEMIPVSAFFPPKKGPRQFNNRTPNLAVPKGKRPKSSPLPPPSPKYQSTIHFDGSNLDMYQSSPRNKVTKIKLKPKRGRVITRYPESDFRRSLTIMSRIK